jgi:phosphate starvation-inducible PhoH-like protein
MTTNTFEIEIDRYNDKDVRFSHLMMNEKASWKKAFEQHFRTTLELIEGSETQNPKILFDSTEANQEKVRNGYNMLLSAHNQKKYINDKLIQSVAARVFVGATNDNTSGGNLRADFNNGVQPKGGWSSDKKNKVKKHAKPYFFKPRNNAQSDLVNLITENDVTFGVGPAGTGKTHVAVAMAVEALNKGEIEKIFLARPAIGTGKDLGALPGGIEEKLAPFMRPLYDELNTVLGNPQKLKQLMEDGTIEIAPVEFMRGRTFKNAFVIVDEAQNCTQEQTRMALTRIGEGSKMVVTGDPMQVDLKDKSDSGLDWAVQRLQDEKGIGVQNFTAEDVVRHPVVARIVKALDGERKEIRKPAAAPKANPKS